MRSAESPWLAALVVLAFAVGACSGDGSGGSVTVTGAWSRATVPGQDSGAVYFEITGGDAGDALLGMAVSADIAAGAALHETVTVDSTATTMPHDMGGSTMADHDMGGGMTMQTVSAVEVGAGDTVVFEPGGYHVMMLGLVQPLTVGQRFDVTLTFENAGEIVVTVEVRE